MPYFRTSCFAFALVTTWASWTFCADQLAKNQNVVTTIHSVEIHPSQRPGGSRSIAILLSSPIAENCLRISVHLLYQCPNDAAWIAGHAARCVDRPHYYPLAASLVDHSFGLATQQMIAGGKVLAEMDLPSAVTAGHYQYVQRSVYFCSWVDGLFQQRLTYETPVVDLMIAAP